MTGFSKGVRVNYRINEVLQSYKAIPSYGIITQQEGQLPYKQEASGAKNLCSAIIQAEPTPAGMSGSLQAPLDRNKLI